MPETPCKEVRLTYAWNWFSYHAGQRLSAFNFFLVIVGVLTVGFGQAISDRWIGPGAAIGGLGAAVSVGFILPCSEQGAR